MSAQNWYCTDNWTASQFQAFLNWCWTVQGQTCNPATAKAFTKTDTFKKLNKAS